MLKKISITKNKQIKPLNGLILYDAHYMILSSACRTTQFYMQNQLLQTHFAAHPELIKVFDSNPLNAAQCVIHETYCLIKLLNQK